MIRSGFDAEIVGNFCLSFQTAELIRFPLSRQYYINTIFPLYSKRIIVDRKLFQIDRSYPP